MPHTHTQGSVHQMYLIVLVLLTLESALSSEPLPLIICTLCSEVLQASNSKHCNDQKATKPRGEKRGHSTESAHAAAADMPATALTVLLVS
jgi:hypothetical protein